MPTYRVKLYNVFLEEFEITAPTGAAAKQLAYDYEYVMGMPREGEMERFVGVVEHVTKHEYQYEEDPEVFGVTAEGELIPLGDGEDSEDDPANAAEETTDGE